MSTGSGRRGSAKTPAKFVLDSAAWQVPDANQLSVRIKDVLVLDVRVPVMLTEQTFCIIVWCDAGTFPLHARACVGPAASILDSCGAL